MAGFRLIALDHAAFVPLFDRSDSQLQAIGARRVVADATRGYPCRVSLEDAQPGEELLLLPFVHQGALGPYQASGPIFVRRGATQRRLAAGAVPAYVASRLISVRAYNGAHMMVDAEVCEGADIARLIEQMFDSRQVSYIHLHNARRGCYACLVERDPAPHEPPFDKLRACP
jgi:hypothetical protein